MGNRIYITGIWRDMDIWRGSTKARSANPHRPWRGNRHLLGGVPESLLNGNSPGVQVEALEKSTHLVPLERPNEVSNLIQSFFEENT